MTTRRNFLKGAAACAATLAAGPGPLVNSLLAADAPPDVVEVKGEKAKAVREAVRLLGGMGRFVTKGAKVVLKPNLGFARTPDVGATTSPEVVAELVAMCLEAGARKVLVLDYPVHEPAVVFERSGVRAACGKLQDTAVFAVDRKEFFVPVEVKEGRNLRKALVARDVLECDTLINVPTAKCHGGGIVSLGLKNLMGTVWDRGYFHGIGGLHECIADLATVVRPALTLVDASRILTTRGPAGPGDLYFRNTIVAGTRIASVDAHAVSLSTWSRKTYRPDEVPHIRLAAAHGLGEIDPAKLRVLRKAV
jgi:uncharacterized protein (DUF362 family)